MALPQLKDGATVLELYRNLVQSIKFLTGKQLECTFVIADGTAKSFATGLGRRWSGAWVMRNSAASSVYAYTGAPDPADADDPTITVYLSSAADVTVTLWVF